MPESLGWIKTKKAGGELDSQVGVALGLGSLDRERGRVDVALVGAQHRILFEVAARRRRQSGQILDLDIPRVELADERAQDDRGPPSRLLGRGQLQFAVVALAANSERVIRNRLSAAF